MNGRAFELYSPTLRVRTLTTPSLFTGSLNGWQAAEEYGAKAYVNQGETFWSYRVMLRRDLAPDEDAGNVFIEASYLASDLRHAWIYPTGLPLGDRVHDLFFARVELPDGWSSNADTVVPGRDRALLGTDLPTHAVHRTWEQLPLAEAVSALQALYQADPIVLSYGQVPHRSARRPRDGSALSSLFTRS
jgi:hypothetical protein